MAKLAIFFGPGNPGRDERETTKKMGKSYQYAMQPICHFYLGTKEQV